MTNSFPTRRSSDLLDRVLNAGLGEDWLLCINNRNLRTFATSLETTLDLLPRIPPALNVVTESGIAMPADVARMRAASVHRFLIGETLMRQPRPSVAFRELIARGGLVGLAGAEHDAAAALRCKAAALYEPFQTTSPHCAAPA